MSLANTNLFKPIKVGSVTIPNRLVYAPTTRFRNSDDFVATDSMLKYYGERALNKGLLIVEATCPAPSFGLYPNCPMIYTKEQVKAWKILVEKVHKNGGFISVQLWHLGRTSSPEFLKKFGLPFVGASPIYADDASKKAAIACGNPLREMTVDEIHAATKEWAAAAKRAINEAKFDFVEIHGAHMYLLDQFLNECSNHRTDQYGGSIENRARFMLEVVDALIEAVGAEHVGIRLSPYAEVQGGEGIKSKINPIVTWGYVLSELERRAKQGKRIAYVSYVEARVSGVQENPNPPDVNGLWINEVWKGIIIRAGALVHEEGYKTLKHYVDGDNRTMIAAGRYYTSNPDLAKRLKNGYPLTKYDRSTFYSHTNDGYLTFGDYGETAKEDKSVPKALA